MQAALLGLRAMQVRPCSSSSFLSGGQQLQQRVVIAPRACRATATVASAAVAGAQVVSVASAAAAAAVEDERLRLNNLSPQPGSKRPRKRKGRGYGAGQGGTAGFGMRGQKSRSGSGIRPGFEGGQTPLYRKLPKLKGIAGGMGAGLPDYVTVNIRDLNSFAEGEEVSLESLQEKRVLNLSGRDTKLQLKVLGTGEMGAPLKVHAAAFSDSARAKIEAAGGTAVQVEVRPKWTRKAHEAKVAASA